MTLINGFIDYIGDLGGFTHMGHYSGIAASQISLISSGCIALASSGVMTMHSDQDSIIANPFSRFDINAGNSINLNAVSDIIGNVTGAGQIEFTTAQSFIHLNAGEDVRFTSAFDVISVAADDHDMAAGRDWRMTGNRIIILDNQSTISDGISGVSSKRIVMQASGLVKLDAPNGNIEFQASGNLTRDIGGFLNSQVGGDVTFNAAGDIIIQSAGANATLSSVNVSTIIGSRVDIQAVGPDDGVMMTVDQSSTGPIIIDQKSTNGLIQQYAYGIEIATSDGDDGIAGSLSGLSRGAMSLMSSGVMNIRSLNAGMNIVSSGTLILGVPGGGWTQLNDGSVTFISQAGSSYTILPGANILFSCGGISTYAGGVFTQVTCASGPTLITSQLSTTTITSEVSNTLVGAKNGQLTLNPWNGSGQLDYRFGPNEAWHTSPSHTSSFFPIAHSGQVRQMILGESTLQTSYAAGNHLVAKSTGGDLRVTAADAKVRLGSNSSRAHLTVSGILNLPTSTADLERGDLWASRHAGILRTDVSSVANASARSLGPATLAYNTGSGIINIATGSGIAQFVNTSANSITSTSSVAVQWDSSDEDYVRDHHYAHANGADGDDIKILVPGLYKISYVLNAEITAAATQTTAKAFCDKNGTQIDHSVSYTPVDRIAESTARITMQSTFLDNFNAGDILRLQSVFENANGSAAYSTIAEQSNLIIQYIGPRRNG